MCSKLLGVVHSDEELGWASDWIVMVSSTFPRPRAEPSTRLLVC